MTTQATASIAIILSVLALSLALISITYMYFAIGHWDEHVYIEAKIEQIAKAIRIRCTGTLKEACSSLQIITPPEGYERYKTDIPKR